MSARASLLSALIGLLMLPGTSAASIVVRESRDKFMAFSGPACGSKAIETLALPAGAFKVVPVGLPVGSALRSIDDDVTPVARITAVTVAPGSVAWTATGSGASCTDPPPPELGWQTSAGEVGASYSRRISRLYLPARCDGPRYRPRSIIIACGDGNLQLRGLRWRGWNGPRAHARGVVFANDCNPYCAAGRFHRLPARVTVSQPRRCRGVYQYMRLRYRLVRRSQGFSRSGATSFGWTCAG